MNAIQVTPIAVVHTPFADSIGMPLQTVSARGIKATIEVFPDFVEGLRDLDGFSHLWLFSYLHVNTTYKMQVMPFLDTQPRGVFATRSPRRPNFIGLSLVRLLAIDQAILHIEDIDLLDGTPLLDIKPYLPQFDNHNFADHESQPDNGANFKVRIGWFDGRIQNVFTTFADDRMKPKE